MGNRRSAECADAMVPFFLPEKQYIRESRLGIVY